jgi:ABC-type lipoprotein release transport system permease subunit
MGSSLHAYQRGICSCLQKLLIHQFTQLYLEGNKDLGNSLSGEECILPVCLSNEYDVHIGDTKMIKLSDKDVTYYVAGIYTDPYQTSTAYDSDILVQKLPTGGRLTIAVYGKDAVTGMEIEAKYRETYPDIFSGSIMTLENRISNGSLVGQIIGAVFLAVGVFMLLVSGLMIYYMIKNAMIADAKPIAVYRTMGYTQADIMAMYLKLYFMVVTLACLIGNIGSVFISNTILTSIFENMGRLKTEYSFLSGLICYLLIIGFVLVLIMLILRKSCRIKPVASLTENHYGGIKKKKHYKGNSTLQFSAFGIAYRTFMREKRSAFSILLTCIVTIFAVNFIVISLDVANGMMENNDYWIGIDQSHIMVNIANQDNFATVKNIIEQDKRTDHTLSCNFDARVDMKWKKGMSGTTMVAFVYEDFEQAALPVTEGRNPITSDEIAISTRMARELHKDIGDYLEIYLDDSTKADMLITGLFQTYMHTGSLCRLTTSTYINNQVVFNYNYISVYLKDQKDMESFIPDMKESLGGKGKVIKRTEQYSSIMNMIVLPQQRAIPPVAALIILIAGINIFSIVFLKNLKAFKINSIYKCIGYTSWHLILSNMIYVLLIALLSILITLPVSLITYAPIMRLCLSAYNFSEYPMQYSTTHLIIANTLVLLVFIISTLASSKSLFKLNARELVQE